MNHWVGFGYVNGYGQTMMQLNIPLMTWLYRFYLINIDAKAKL